MACNEYYGLTEVHRRNVVTYGTEEDTPVHLSISCNHCANPVCVTVCPENNFEKRGDGIVIHRPHNCQACLRCISACPFHALKINPKTNRADKCNFCVERIDQGLKPVCVENCVTSALGMLVVQNDALRSYSIEEADVPIKGYTSPSIFVINKQKGKTFFREG
jgi:Fe-S-cluster-containing dehydrogenase component